MLDTYINWNSNFISTEQPHLHNLFLLGRADGQHCAATEPTPKFYSLYTLHCIPTIKEKNKPINKGKHQLV